MKLIVGLGNPGEKYLWTRHNFGFTALDFYAIKHDLKWEKERFGALWLRNGDKILIKPQEFYNDSGFPVQNFLHYYKLAPQDILVICDDFNLPFGTLRYRSGGSDGGNRGLRSISTCLGTTDYPRLRFGTGSDLRAKTGDIDFVLGKFTAEEKQKILEMLSETDLICYNSKHV